MQVALTQTSWFGLNLQDCLNHSGLSKFNDLLLWSQLAIGLLVLMIIIGLVLNSLFFSGSMEWHALEVVWTLLPGLVLVGLGVPSLTLLYELESGLFLPDFTVKIMGSQWYWNYDLLDYGMSFDAYFNSESLFGHAEASNSLVLPVNSSILVLVTSTDVIHSWALPSLGVKADCNPGRLNSMWVFSSFPTLIFSNCFELCGAYHSMMPIMVEFTLPSLFVEWATAEYPNSFMKDAEFVIQ